MNEGAVPSDELQAILDSLLSTGGAPRTVRRRLQDLLGQMPADTREIFLLRAFDRATDLLAGDSRLVLQGVRKMVIACREVDAGRGTAAGISEAHFSPGDAPRDRIVDLADGARRSIDACVFTITDDRIADALRRAHEREVRVRIITDDLKSSEPGSDILSLRGSGLLVVTDRSLAHMHHKFAIVDRIVLVSGSYNWTLSAARSNLDDITVTNDHLLVDRFVTRFEELWRSFGGAGAP